MKLKYLTLIIISFFCLSSNAQTENNAYKNTNFGIEICPYPINIYQNALPFNPHINFNAGITLQHFFSKRIGFRTGIEFSYLTFSVLPETPYPPPLVSESLNFQFVSLPLDIIFRFRSNSATQVLFYIGIYPTYELNGQDKRKYADGEVINYKSLGPEDIKISSGPNLGIEIKHNFWGISLDANGVNSQVQTLNLTVKYYLK